MKKIINIAPEGYKIIFSVFVVWIITYLLSIYFSYAWIGISSVYIFYLLLIICYFFRDPIRKIIYNEQSFLSPADGRIVSIKDWEDPDVGQSTKIAIFLSFLNVHRQWIPLNAKVLDTFYNPGRFFGAFKNKASEKNEQTSILFRDNNENIFKIKQIAGFIARRILNYMVPENLVQRGQRLGFIRFGSRVDIILPRDFQIDVSLGDMVQGNKTIIGQFQ